MTLFKLPDLGEGLVEAEIVEWFCKEGDTITADSLMVALETAKAIVDIPSPQTGKVVKLFGQVGDIIHTGDPLLEFASSETSTQEKTISDKETASSVVGVLSTEHEAVKESASAVSQHSHSGIKATPAVRALASRMDIDLSIVTPSGPQGTIKTSDVQRVAKILANVGALQPLKGPRRAMAKAMEQAHSEVVSVTINDDADISTWPQHSDVSCRLIRALLIACTAEPGLNAWYDSHSIGRRLIKAVHLGLALDTKDGLFVPVIKDVQDYKAAALREKINDLKIQVQQRKIPAEALRGNTITLSNFGAIGGKYANPIIMPPTVAILGAGRSFESVKVNAGHIEAATFLPLSLSFDHRSITGAEAGRFLQSLINDLQQAQ
ncbi:MAG: 2-oxo acid dehydrogenase subunit E2 [Pseudomonadales bacterium]|nr:2-oxo acid dehydrogenase subunit E2 [Pseudomonadales bacterium]